MVDHSDGRFLRGPSTLVHSLRLVALSLLVAGCSGNVSSGRTTGDEAGVPGTGGAGGATDASVEAGAGGTSDGNAPGAGGAGTGGRVRPPYPSLEGGIGTGGTSDADVFGPIHERSGTRIQVVDWVSGSVPVTRKELFDTEKSVPCEIARAEDGVFRCLPVAQGSRIFFLDDRCTQPVIETAAVPPRACPGPESSYVTYPAFASCPEPRQRVVAQGGAIETPAQLYADRGDHECSGAGASGPLHEALPVSPVDFVAFDRQVIEETPSLGIETWQGEDGARARGTLRYLPEDIECAAAPADGGQPLYLPPPLESPSHCAPAHPARIGPWTTAPDCSSGGEVIALGNCDPRPFAVAQSFTFFDDGGFAFGPSFLRVGSPVTSGVWLYLLGRCGQVDGVVPHLVFHEPGPRVPLTDFPRLDLVRSAPSPVERLGWVAREGGTALPTGRIGWSDPGAGSGSECTPMTFADGTVLCVPPNGGFGEWPSFTLPVAHTDPTCSLESVVDVFAGDLIGGGRPPDVGQWIVVETPSWCMSDAVTTRQVIAHHQGVVYGMILGACLELTPDAWWVADLGPPRPAREVLPRLAAYAL